MGRQADSVVRGSGRHVAWPAGLLVVFLAASLFAADPGRFYAQRGSDPPIAEVLKSGDLPRGRNSDKGVKGSTVRVNHDLLKTGPNARRRIAEKIRIHTLGNSFIRRDSFSRWSRWYQEDRNTQVFRLFKGEENVRNSREKAARIEAYSDLEWTKGDWQEWVGTYTILKPHGACIFQVKNNENEWAVQLNMSAGGDIRLNHRRAKDEVIARDMVGKPFHVRVRDNGHDYEVYLNGVKKGTGSYARPKGKTSFRWGMYLGGNEVTHDAMIFVTGAGINPKDYKPELARVEEESTLNKWPDEPEPPEGVTIPERVWTNADGDTVRAAAVYQPRNGSLKLKVHGRWVDYPLGKLSKEDRDAVRNVAETERQR